MKRIILVILIAIFSAVSASPVVAYTTPVIEQKKGDKKKDPPGPANVKPKESRDNRSGDKSSDRSGDRQEKPKKGKKPGNE